MAGKKISAKRNNSGQYNKNSKTLEEYHLKEHGLLRSQENNNTLFKAKLVLVLRAGSDDREPINFRLERCGLAPVVSPKLSGHSHILTDVCLILAF